MFTGKVDNGESYGRLTEVSVLAAGDVTVFWIFVLCKFRRRKHIVQSEENVLYLHSNVRRMWFGIRGNRIDVKGNIRDLQKKDTILCLILSYSRDRNFPQHDSSYNTLT